MIDFLLRKFEAHQEKDAFVWGDAVFSYGRLLEQIAAWRRMIQQKGLQQGAVVLLEADFSPNSIALFLALMEHRCVIVPLTKSVEAQKQEFSAVAQGEWVCRFAPDDQAQISRTSLRADHDYYSRLRADGHPGLVLFSSGSTGPSKAAVHDLARLMEKFKTPRQTLRTITFLLFDHIGGVNTMFYTLSNAGCLITIEDRSPDGVFRAIEKHKVELLPTSPTFINLTILSEAYKRYDTGSLKIITYGTEPMPEETLKKIHAVLPHVRLQQTYGLSELGILRSKSMDSGSLWMKIGGEGYETKIVDGKLWIRAESAMLGYLNAPSPFDAQGWFNTEDEVETDGDYLRILGRTSEIINVGGEKVYPVEVENVIQAMDGVEEITVRGERNPIMGQIVRAEVRLGTQESAGEFKKRMSAFCRGKLPPFKIPQKVVLVSGPGYSERFKKMRQGER